MPMPAASVITWRFCADGGAMNSFMIGDRLRMVQNKVADELQDPTTGAEE